MGESGANNPLLLEVHANAKWYTELNIAIQQQDTQRIERLISRVIREGEEWMTEAQKYDDYLDSLNGDAYWLIACPMELLDMMEAAVKASKAIGELPETPEGPGWQEDVRLSPLGESDGHEGCLTERRLRYHPLVLTRSYKRYYQISQTRRSPASLVSPKRGPKSRPTTAARAKDFLFSGQADAERYRRLFTVQKNKDPRRIISLEPSRYSAPNSSMVDPSRGQKKPHSLPTLRPVCHKQRLLTELYELTVMARTARFKKDLETRAYRQDKINEEEVRNKARRGQHQFCPDKRSLNHGKKKRPHTRSTCEGFECECMVRFREAVGIDI